MAKKQGGKKMKRMVVLATIFSVFLINPASGYSAGPRVKDKKFSQPEALDLTPVWQAWGFIRDEYVDGKDVDNETILRGMVKGLIYAIGDKHGFFFKTDDFKNFVSATHSGVDGEIITDQKRGGKTIKIGRLKIDCFTGTTDGEMRSELKRLLDLGADRLILDIRDNPGGMLEAAVDVCGAFLGPNKVIFIKCNRHGEEEIVSTGEKVCPNIPIVCLINKSSASAAEILAGALRDHGRAKLIGQKSYGKGSIQTSMELTVGIIMITTHRWLTPNRTVVDGVGLTPEIETDKTSHILSEAIKIISDM